MGPPQTVHREPSSSRCSIMATSRSHLSAFLLPSLPYRSLPPASLELHKKMMKMPTVTVHRILIITKFQASFMMIWILRVEIPLWAGFRDLVADMFCLPPSVSPLPPGSLPPLSLPPRAVACHYVHENHQDWQQQDQDSSENNNWYPTMTRLHTVTIKK